MVEILQKSVLQTSQPIFYKRDVCLIYLRPIQMTVADAFNKELFQNSTFPVLKCSTKSLKGSNSLLSQNSTGLS